MTDVIGTISACLDLADRIAELYKRIKGAEKRLETIATSVSRLSSILRSLEDVLKPDLKAGLTAPRLPNDGLRNSLIAVKDCKDTFNAIWRELDEVAKHQKVKRSIQYGEAIKLDWAEKTFFIFREAKVAEYNDRLRTSKEDVMLSLLVNQLWLAKQPAQ